MKKNALLSTPTPLQKASTVKSWMNINIFLANPETGKSTPVKVRWFVTIFLVAVLLHFWGAFGNDMHHDFALNSTRALGWFDFIVGEGQTTPIRWFGQNPWWANLSFHDHPPFSFFLQFISFRIFRQNPFAARFPFALAGLATLAMVYIFVRRAWDEKTALIATLLLALSSYFLWSVKSGYLEAIESFFLVTSVFSLLQFVRSDEKKYLYGWAISSSLALLTKYTALFLFPAAFLFLLAGKRKTFASRHFWFSLLLVLFFLSPVIVYNVKMFQTRGHFDAALSSMLGLSPKDFSVLSYRGYTTDIFANISSMARVLFENVSLPILILELSSLLFFLYGVFAKKTSPEVAFFLLNILLIGLMFLFPGTEARFFSIIVPFLAVLASVFLAQIWRKLKEARGKIFFFIVTAAIFSFEFFYSLNTNIFVRPLISNPFFFSRSRFYNIGFEALEHYLRSHAMKDFSQKITRPKQLGELEFHESAGRDIILYDERSSWFSRVWYIQRYQIYYNAPFISFSDMEDTVRDLGLEQANIFDLLKESGAKSVWTIISLGRAVSETKNVSYNNFVRQFEKTLLEAGISPKAEIYDYNHDVSFRVYGFALGQEGG